jgi:hypothetical protein
MQWLNMGELRVDTVTSPPSTHDRFGVLAHVCNLISHMNTEGAAPTAWRYTSECPWLDVRLTFMQGERG